MRASPNPFEVDYLLCQDGRAESGERRGQALEKKIKIGIKTARRRKRGGGRGGEEEEEVEESNRWFCRLSSPGSRTIASASCGSALRVG